MKTTDMSRAALFTVIVIAVLLFVVGCATSHSSSFPVLGPAFNGNIQAIDRTAHRLTIAPLKQSPAVVFHWNNDSKFWANGLRIEPRQLQTGDLVRIHYLPDSEPKTVQHLYLQTHRTIH